jgi:hypothetical protein
MVVVEKDMLCCVDRHKNFSFSVGLWDLFATSFLYYQYYSIVILFFVVYVEIVDIERDR